MITFFVIFLNLEKKILRFALYLQIESNFFFAKCIATQGEDDFGGQQR